MSAVTQNPAATQATIAIPAAYMGETMLTRISRRILLLLTPDFEPLGLDSAEKTRPSWR